MVVASSKSGGGACGGPHCVAHDAQEAMDAESLWESESGQNPDGGFQIESGRMTGKPEVRPPGWQTRSMLGGVVQLGIVRISNGKSASRNAPAQLPTS